LTPTNLSPPLSPQVSLSLSALSLRFSENKKKKQGRRKKGKKEMMKGREKKWCVLELKGGGDGYRSK
jgi:hypothetical protein